MAEKAGRKEKFCYGIGDFACNGCFTIVSSYLMYFYTDIAKINLAAVGMIILVSRLIDAVSCLGMGTLIDRTNTRWGKVRPYLIGTIFPLCLNLVLLFYSPNVSQNMKIGYAMITATIYSVLYSGLSVSYSTMMTCMTKDNQERLSFNLMKNISANLGALFVTSITLFLVNRIGKENVQHGFTVTMSIYAVIYILIICVCFFHTKERIQIAEEKISIGNALKIAMKNKHWILLCLLEFLMLTAMTMRNQGTMYYAKYCLGEETMATVLLSVSTFMAIPMIFVVTKLAAVIGKKKCIMLGNLFLLSGIAGVWMAGKNVGILLAFHVLASVGWGIASGMVFVMIAEVVDYSEYQTGRRPQGFLTSVVSLMMKLGVASAGFVSAKVLQSGDYVSGQMQTDRSLQAITANYIWIPLVVTIFSMIVVHFYTLDKEYPMVEKELEKRRSAQILNNK